MADHFRLPESTETGGIKPGHWRVEGFDVERVPADGKIWWQVYSRYPGKADTFHGKRRSLNDACALIWGLLEQKRVTW